jgi:hypothetical protein
MPLSVSASQGATLNGRVVHKTSKGGIPGAEVRLSPKDSQLVTDSAGYFRFDHVAAGLVSLFVRRLGFAPESASFQVQASDDLDLLIELQQSAQTLDTVTVAEREIPLAERRLALAGFYERKRLGGGRFFSPEELDKQQHRTLGQIITATTPGSRLVRSLTGTMAWIATARRPGITLQPLGSSIDEYDRQRGADPKACYPDVYLDGAVVYSFGRQNSLFDINSIATSAIAAVEFYVGPSQIPLQYNKTSAVCGVVLIWTK